MKLASVSVENLTERIQLFQCVPVFVSNGARCKYECVNDSAMSSELMNNKEDTHSAVNIS